MMRHSVGKLAVSIPAAPSVIARALATLLPATLLAASLHAPAPAVAASASASAVAEPALPFTPCKESTQLACAHLTVPLDPSGMTPGTVTLAIRRRLAPVGGARTAVIALAGGPGQSAIPFTENFTELLGPILDTRDLIVFDQRGTGYSHPLACHGFEQPGAYRTYGKLVSSCAEQIGPARAFYTTLDTVADIEALRKALGYEKLVLYGTSYGTKVAEEYAQQYPHNVEALVLDSVVPPAGPDPLDRATFAAIPRILRQLCRYGMCQRITRNPVRDLARLVRRMGGGVVVGRYVGPHGHAIPVPITSNELADILLAGDFNPILRAEFPAAARAADARDYAPLARLLVRAAGGEREEGEGIDVPLFLTTSCEEQTFPWSRAAGPRQRLAQATAAIDASGESAFAPFNTTNVLDFDMLRTCAHWPFATPAPPAVPAMMPNVPTLILSGADDLRTPTANARQVAAQIPDAHLLVVPNTGHAVLVDEPTSCARKALRAMFNGGVGVHAIQPCRAGPPPALLRPTPLAPSRLADVTPAHGYRGRAGRTLAAVRLTIAAAARELTIKLLEAGGALGAGAGGGLDSGGLRSGWVGLGAGGLSFHDYSYVPGITLVGTIRSEHATLRIGGHAGANGVLHLGAHHLLVGELEGQRVQVRASEARTSAAEARASRAQAGRAWAGGAWAGGAWAGRAQAGRAWAGRAQAGRAQAGSARAGRAQAGRAGEARAHGIPANMARPDAIVGGDAQASPDLGNGSSAGSAAIDRLAGLLNGLPWPQPQLLPLFSRSQLVLRHRHRPT